MNQLSRRDAVAGAIALIGSAARADFGPHGYQLTSPELHVAGR